MSPMGLVVQKFGGTSVGDAQKIHRAARRAIRARLAGTRVVMVVSAMGDTTDRLLGLANDISLTPCRRELDMLLTTGEQVSIALMAMAIHAAGHEAISLTAGQLGLVTDSVHTRARIRSIQRGRLERELDAGKIVIVAGFQGIDAAGELTTLGRGASDTTAAALAAVLNADACEIYTDVDGVYTADPRLVPNARKIDRISYDEMLELAAAGAGVMHSRAIEFATRFNVPIHVRSSLTDSPGTMIVAEDHAMESVTVRGVTIRDGLAVIGFVGVPNAPGFAAKVFAAIADKHINVDDIVQNIYAGGAKANVGFVVEAPDAAISREIAERLAAEHGFEDVEFRDDLCKISAVGVGMRSHAGVAATIFQALRDANVNIHAISTSEIVISCVVPRADGGRALAAVHDAFGLGGGVDPSKS